ncbi:MAG: sugar kinase [Candidatus Helarchaeota archaeon]|nr:sugar kinase [Candidatus Helarchaeota archaeon]
MFDVITFGEAMIRLSPPNFERLENAVALDLKIGGTEANVAIALARLKLKTSWYSRLTDNSLGRRIENEIRKWKVDTNHLIWTSDSRVGLYFLEFGSKPRPSKVIYDRKNSAISKITKNEIDWKYLEETKLFHTSGITVALSNSCRELVSSVLDFCRSKNIITSFDINYRSKLWPVGEASDKLKPLLNKIDIIMSSENDIDLLFSYKGDFKEKAKKMMDEFKPKIIAITRGPDSPIILDETGKILLGTGNRPNLVDRIGAGDAFAGGIIYGYLKNDIEKGLQYAEAMSALKFSIPGDFAIISIEEIEDFIKTKKSTIDR